MKTYTWPDISGEYVKRADYNALLNQRAELLAALERISHGYNDPTNWARSIADEAIARAKNQRLINLLACGGGIRRQ